MSPEGDAPIIAIGITVRWVHLALSLLIYGALAMLILAGRSDRPTARAWEARVLRTSGWLLLGVLASGLAALAQHAAVLSGHAGAAIDPAVLLRVLLETHWGLVWLTRHGILVLLAALLAVRLDVERPLDWRAARGEAALLASVALGLLAAAGHAAAVEPGTALAIGADTVHLLASGLWLGGLLPLAALLTAAATEGGADSRPYAVLAARRFSRVALASVLVLVASGVLNAATHVAGFPNLVGTVYGRLLLAKLALLVPILALGALNRSRGVPALSGDAPRVGRPAMRRLARAVVVEAALGAMVIAVVAALGMTPPARHESPTWPFAFRLSLAALPLTPGGATRALLGSQLAVLALVSLVASVLLGGARRALLVTAGTALGVALLVGLPPLIIDAYPTTYRRPDVAYRAASIAEGARLYPEHCASCHASGAPDLRGARVRARTAGDLFWWIGRGGSGHPAHAFDARLAADARWDLVNFIRALGDAERGRGLSPVVEPERPWLPAPDFAFAVGPTPPRALKDYRGRRIVLVVLYSLPGSGPRLGELARAYDVLVTLGVEVIAVPTDAARDALKRLGPEPRIFFPVVTDGAPAILATYRLFGAAPHAEFLVDRQGYLRARWLAGDGATREVNALLAEIQQLNEEKTAARAPEEHVH